MKRTPIRRVSKKRAKQNAEYMKLRKKFLEDHPVCQICNDEVANQIHHTNKRNGTRLNDQKYWMALGIRCHIYIHTHPEAARKEGWLL